MINANIKNILIIKLLLIIITYFIFVLQFLSNQTHTYTFTFSLISSLFPPYFTSTKQTHLPLISDTFLLFPFLFPSLGFLSSQANKGLIAQIIPHYLHSYRYCLQTNSTLQMMETTERIYNSTTNPKPSQIGSGMQNLVPKPPHALFSRKPKIPTLCSIPTF